MEKITTGLTSIEVTLQKDKNTASSKNVMPGSLNSGSRWYVNYRTEIITKNTVINPDSFSGVIFENIGEDRCNIFNLLPVNPSDKTREFLNRPGEIITTQIPIQFAGNSDNKKLSVIYVYYELIKS